MPTIYIDNQPYEVAAGGNLLETVLSLGLDLPYFCWHPALDSVGSCRQCAIKQYKDEDDQEGKLVMACMTPTSDGTRISVADPAAVEFRKNIIEWLMVNHPHDCPVCDEGGECHLQDMTVMTGHNYRRHRFQKRTFVNQNLGPFIHHEMNRCITCYRCVRFYRDYAGGTDLEAFASHDHIYFGRHQDGTLESEFSGNLVEVCPTGVFTDKTLRRHYTRKWDLQTAPSVCHHCALGCNTIPGERYQQLRRILNRFNHDVNGYFLCDRGRFGYEFVNSQHRVEQPLVQEKQATQEISTLSWQEAQQQLAEWVNGSEKVIGIGSPRASLEANYALRSLVGKDHFYHGMSDPEGELLREIVQIIQQGPVHTASLQETEEADAVLVLGEDLINTAPRLALALRQTKHNQAKEKVTQEQIPAWHDAAVREASLELKVPFYLAHPFATKLDNMATRCYHETPDKIAQLAAAIAHYIEEQAPKPTDLCDELSQLAQEIAEVLQKAQRPLVVAGSSLQSKALLQAAANVANALHLNNPQAKICYTVPECNSLGVSLLEGKDLGEALATAEVDTAIVLENDLYRRAPGKEVQRFLQKIKHLVVVDATYHPTAKQANLLLPGTTFAEESGILVNNEGRFQRYFKVFPAANGALENWRQLRALQSEAGQNLGELHEEMAQEFPLFARFFETQYNGNYRVVQQKIPRQTQRYSGRTAMYADQTKFEPQPPADPDSPLAHSMEGTSLQPPSPLVSFFWMPGWNSEQATNKYQSEVGGPLRGGDPGVRLLEPDSSQKAKFFEIASPETVFSSQQEEQWLLVPVPRIFGSEELSSMAPGIQQRMEPAYLTLHPEDAQKLQVENHETLELTVQEKSVHMPVRIAWQAGKSGVIGWPVGLPDGEWLKLPAWGRVAKSKGGNHA